jgi:hypothetical protein
MVKTKVNDFIVIVVVVALSSEKREREREFSGIIISCF